MPSVRAPRLDQLLASLGYGKRREVEGFLKDGRVRVEGEPKARPDLRVESSRVSFDGKPLDYPEGLLVVLHKPRGYVCTHDDREGPTVYGLLPERWSRRSPAVESIGRLDKDTSGLLLLTDRHQLIHRLTSPKHHVPKVYEAEVEADLTPRMAEIFASGTLLLHGETKPCLPAKLDILGARRARVTLNEGRYHQVRRMFGTVGAPVLKLHRSAFGCLELGSLRECSFRVLEARLENVEGGT